MKKLPRTILASKSPARRLLMKELGIPFECHTSDYEEDMYKYRHPV
jgi:predicted house-cleaning NTP pyrophosphatase (Maf/HAM1 superfamily)